MTRVPPLTRDEVSELAQNRTTTNVETLARSIGTGKNIIYEAIARGEWTATRVLRVGHCILIPTADILKLIEAA
jgi:hypothetical protein